MKKIEGIDLLTIVDHVEHENMEAIRDAIAKQVRGMVSDIQTWARVMQRNTAENEKLSDKINKAREKLTKIRAGDWSLVNDPNAKDSKDD